jgi:hypothetical protein
LNDETRALTKRVIDKMLVEEYRRILSDGVEAIEKMEENGYTKEEIIALLTYEPLAKWGKVVARIIDNV